jgi:hypothetical protein
MQLSDASIDISEFFPAASLGFPCGFAIFSGSGSSPVVARAGHVTAALRLPV